MKKLIFCTIFMALLSFGTKVSAKELLKETQDVIKKCDKQLDIINANNDKELSEHVNIQTACIKKELIDMINFMHSNDPKIKQKLLSLIDNTAENIILINDIIANKNQYCENYFGCGTTNKHLFPAERYQEFIVNLLDGIYYIKKTQTAEY